MICRRRLATALIALSPLAAGPAGAADCSTQVGKSIFWDTFQDDSGNFEADDAAKFNAMGLHLTIGSNESAWAYATKSSQATNGDFCVIATMPAPAASDNLAAVGLTVLYSDADNMITVFAFSDNTVQIERRSKGVAEFLFSEGKPDVGAAPGEEVAVRAVVRNGTISAFVNNVAIKPVHVQVPDGPQRFGVYGRLDKDPGKPFPIDFKMLRVTSGDDFR